MTWLEVLLSIWGGTYVPRRKRPPPPDRAEGHAWILGASILASLVVYMFAKMIANWGGPHRW